MSTEQENKEAIIRIEGDLKLIHQKIDTIKDNHLEHVSADINRLSKFYMGSRWNCFCSDVLSYS